MAVGTRLEQIHRTENPFANRESVKKIVNYLQVSARATRISARLERRRLQRQLRQTAVPEDAGITELRSELQARVNAGLNGDGTFTDRAFVVAHIGEFEKPIGDGSVTIVEF